MALYSSSCTSIDLAKQQQRAAVDTEPDGDSYCRCGEFAADNDRGFCLFCGLWINYRDNQ